MLRGLIAASVALVVAAVVVFVATDSAAATAIGSTLIGIAVVCALSAVFYVVGRSEDRDRERRPRG